MRVITENLQSLALCLMCTASICYAANGGPDSFNYRFIDSAEEGGPQYNFIDISSTGSPVVSGDDAASSPISLEPSFPLYGQSVSQLSMASNGYLSTDPVEAGIDISSDCQLPKEPSSGSGARLYVLHDDLDLSASQAGGYYQRFSNCPRSAGSDIEIGCHVFMWRGAQFFPADPSQRGFDFEVLLYDNGDIVFQFGPGNSASGFRSTTGIQDGGFTIGLTYSCRDAGSINSNSAVLFFLDSDGDGLRDSPDFDFDGIPDHSDGCPEDPAKHSPGFCGCSVSDSDSDINGIPDCVTTTILKGHVTRARSILFSIKSKNGRWTAKGKRLKSDYARIIKSILTLGAQSQSFIRLNGGASNLSLLLSRVQSSSAKIKSSHPHNFPKLRKPASKALYVLDHALQTP